MSKLYITIKADTNDADYIELTSEISKEEIETLKPLIEKIKEKGRHTHNWTTSEYADECNPKTYLLFEGITEDMIESFDSYIPIGEYGIHTIESITLREIVYEEKLL